MHQHNGLCFVDFACSGPYVKIDMHPEDGESYLDAIFFSHKFLGGPGTCGVLVFNKKLYQNLVPDNPWWNGKLTILGANTNTSIISKIGKMEVRRFLQVIKPHWPFS
jgi:selenocysteine lyase/cysteine desulfurase